MFFKSLSRTCCFLITAFITTLYANSQPVKKLAGTFIYEVQNDLETNTPFKVSSSGNSLATRDPYHRFSIIDLSNGIIRKPVRKLDNAAISPDHQYLFANGIYPIYADKNLKGWGSEIRSVGTITDTALRRIALPYYALTMDEKNNLIASKIQLNAGGHITIMQGLYRLDRISGKALQTLRPDTDTLFNCTKTDGCSLPFIRVQKDYLLMSESAYASEIEIRPFGNEKKLVIRQNNHNRVVSDSSLVYTLSDSTLAYNIVSVFSANSGALLARTVIDRPANAYLNFAFFKNRFYYYDFTTGMLQEQTLSNENFIRSRTWNVADELKLSKAQSWDFIVLKGPSFFFVPRKMDKAEAGELTANAATLFNGASGKTILHIYPFYNRSANDIAIQEKAMKAQNDFLAEQTQEKIANDPCRIGWNTPQFNKGLTRKWETRYVILMSFDCKADEYKVWQPAQWNSLVLRDEPDISYSVSGQAFRRFSQTADKAYITCTACEGDGSTEVTVYTTKTKELPWGYFSGIETKKITTTASTYQHQCKVCNGRGVVLK